MANLGNFLIQVRHRAQAAVSCGQSPLTGWLITGHTSKSLSAANMFLIAFCGIPVAVGSNTINTGWVHAKCLVAMARYYFDHHSDWTSMDADMREAMLYGALTALWSIPTTTLFIKEEVRDARTKIIKKLHTITPNSNMVKTALTTWVKIMSQRDFTVFHQTGAQLFPIHLSSGYTGTIKTQLDGLCNGNDDPNAVFPTFTVAEQRALAQPAPSATISLSWSSLTHDQIVCFFSVFSFDSEDPIIDQTKALFTQIATISKTSYTEAWIDSRWQNLVTDSPNMAEADKVSRETLIHYGNLFQGATVSAATKVTGLVFNHHIASAAKFQGIVRMIEQSKAPHVGGLTALCELIMQYSSASYTALSHTFGKGQTRSIVRLAAMIIHNPYCTISGPPITVSMYADIAYVATELMYNTNRRPGSSRYQSPSTNFTRKPVAFLKQYIQSIIQTEVSHGQTLAGPIALLQAYGLSATLDDAAQAYVITPSSDTASSSTGNSPSERFPVSIPANQITSYIIRQQNDDDKAFKFLMEELQSAIRQSSFPPQVITDGGTWAHPVLNTTPLSAEVLAAVNRLGVPTEQGWNASENILTDRLYTSYRIPESNVLVNLHRVVAAAVPGSNAGQQV